jgi:endonuclease YncB( thermonuclease family)
MTMATRRIMGTITITATDIVTITTTTIRTITDALRLLLIAALLNAPAACSEPADPGSVNAPRDGYFYGRVTRVVDGDTLTMKTADGRALRIRLAEIDTPEKGEPFSNRARGALNQMVRDRDIAVRLFDVDSYGRIVGRVYVGELDVNAALVEQGLAVVYRRWAEDPRLYELEEEARAAKLGVWSGGAIPRGAGRVPQSGGPSRAAGCDNKRYCSEMSSCEEALLYLEQCGLDTLDGDSDGVPCEWALCR